MIRQTILFRVSLSVLMLMTQCSAFCQASVYLIIKCLIVFEIKNLANAVSSTTLTL